MSAHSIGSATVSFGLVSVPVKMFSAGESSANISFNWLHKKDGARLKQQYVCSKDGEKVEKEEMIKGYEFTKGQYVLFTPDGRRVGDGAAPVSGGAALDRRRADPEDRSQEGRAGHGHQAHRSGDGGG